MKVNSHIIAQTYLREFSHDRENIGRYDMKTSSIKESLPIIKVSAHKNYFAYKDDQGNFYSIEGLLSDVVEGPYKEIISKIRNKTPLTQEDIDNLAVFLSFQFLRPTKLRRVWESSEILVRTKAIQAHIREDEDSLKGFYDYIVGKGKFSGSVDDLRAVIMNLKGDEMKWEDNYANYKGSLNLLEQAKDIHDQLRTLKPYPLYDRKLSLISSDNPYFIWQADPARRGKEPLGLGVNGEQVYFPLARDVLLVLSMDSPGGVLSPSEVNQHIVNAADRFIYFPVGSDIKDFLLNRVPEMRYEVFPEHDGVKILRT